MLPPTIQGHPCFQSDLRQSIVRDPPAVELTDTVGRIDTESAQEDQTTQWDPEARRGEDFQVSPLGKDMLAAPSPYADSFDNQEMQMIVYG